MLVSDFLNKHVGRLCFVLESGPSLHFERLDGIENYVSFVVNSAFLKLRTADYFVTNNGDARSWDYFTGALSKARAISFLPSDHFEDNSSHLDKSKVCLFDHKYTFDLQERKVHPSSFVITKEEPLIGVGPSSMTAIQIASIMGCDPIVLMGADCSYITDHNHFWMFPGEPKPRRISGNTFPSRKYMMRNKMYDDEHKEMLEHWSVFGKCNPHINIISATTQGLLDCFPKMSYGDVLSRYGLLFK